MTTPSLKTPPSLKVKSVSTLLLVAVSGAVILWSYWPEFGVIAEKWYTEEEYSHGWLVPLFSVLLLGMRVPHSSQTSSASAGDAAAIPWSALLPVLLAALLWAFGTDKASMTVISWTGLAATVIAFAYFIQDVSHGSTSESGWGRWGGLVLVAIACGCRILAARFNAEWIDHISLIPLLLGIAWALGGETILKWATPAILYLVFMIPLPFRIEVAMRQPLRQFSTKAATYTLQTLGFPAFAEGNTVMVEEVSLDIVEACSGLSMLMVFFAISCAVAIMSNRFLWQKVLLVLSAIPIALISNVARITVQGLLFVNQYDGLAIWFHDQGAPWLMMGLAMTLLIFELWYLDNLIIVELKEPMSLGLEDQGPKPAAAQ